MAQTFNDAVLTKSGAALLAKAQAGECTLKFTKMAIGDGEYSDTEKETSALEEATELKSEKNSYSISSLSVYSDISTKIKALFTNYDTSTSEALVTEDYSINEIGLYAQADDDDSTEILYSIAVVSGDEGDLMPAYDGANPVQIIQTYYVTVNNGTDVTFSTSGAVALVEDMDATRTELLDMMIQIDYDEDSKTLIITGADLSEYGVATESEVAEAIAEAFGED